MIVTDEMVERALSAPYGAYSVSSFIPLKSPHNIRELMRAALEAALAGQASAGRELVAKWREFAESVEDQGDGLAAAYIRDCADELERALADAAPVARDMREFLGKLVRMEWMAWAREQPNPKPSWLQPWGELTEPEREVDRRIGERIYRMAIEAQYASPAAPVAAEAVTALPDAFDEIVTLEKVRGLLESAPEYALGVGSDGYGMTWSLRDEAIDGLSKVIRALADAAPVGARPWDEGSPCVEPRPVGMVYPPKPAPRASGYLDDSGVEWNAYDTGQMEAYARASYATGYEAAIAHLSGEPAGEINVSERCDNCGEVMHLRIAAPRAAGQASAVGALVAKWRERKAQAWSGGGVYDTRDGWIVPKDEATGVVVSLCELDELERALADFRQRLNDTLAQQWATTGAPA